MKTGFKLIQTEKKLYMFIVSFENIYNHGK